MIQTRYPSDMPIQVPVLISFLIAIVLFSAWEIAYILWLAPHPSKTWSIIRAILLGLIQSFFLVGAYMMLRSYEERALASSLWVGGILGLGMALLGWLHEGVSKEQRTGRLVIRTVGTLVLSVGIAAITFFIYR